MDQFPKADEIFRHIGAIQEEQSHLFAGRDTVVRSVLESLEQSGTVPVIFGEKGIGKSSIGWRLFNILNHKDTIPEFEKLTADYDLDDNYIPLWIECGDWFSGIESALLALLLPRGLRQAVTIRDLFPDFITDDQRAKAEATFELNLAIFKAGTRLSTVDDRDAITRALRAATDKALSDPIEMFSQICAKLLDHHPTSTVVIFIDEFDRLPDKALVGSILKTLTRIRFVIVGIAKTSSELVGSHSSVDRKISNIPIPPLPDDEALQIFENASATALSYEGSKGIYFSDEYKRKVVADTGGYPNLIQKIGFYSIQPNRLHRRMFTERVDITLDDYLPALTSMFKTPNRRGAAEDEVELNLSNAVGDSSRRTEILRAMVSLGNNWVSLAELFNVLDRSVHQQLQANLERFVETGVFVTRDDDGYRFTSPIYLMAASLMLEVRDQSDS